MHTVVPQGCLLSQFIFFVYTSKARFKWIKICRRCGVLEGSFKHQLLIDIQIAILNLQNWCSKWCIPVNSMKTDYRVFCDKKNKAPCGQIPVTIDGNCLKKVFTARTRNHNRWGTFFHSSSKKANKHITSVRCILT